MPAPQGVPGNVSHRDVYEPGRQNDILAVIRQVLLNDLSNLETLTPAERTAFRAKINVLASSDSLRTDLSNVLSSLTPDQKQNFRTAIGADSGSAPTLIPRYTYRGPYNPNETYQIGDVVLQNNRFWILHLTSEGNANAPGTSNSDGWKPIDGQFRGTAFTQPRYYDTGDHTVTDGHLFFCTSGGTYTSAQITTSGNWYNISGGGGDGSGGLDAAAVTQLVNDLIAAEDHHARYTDAEARNQGDAAVSIHEGQSNPHSVYATDGDLAAHALTTHGGAAAVAAHVGQSNPHSVYATDADLAAHAATTHGGGGEGGASSFSELTGQASDAQIPAGIARDSEVTALIAAEDHHAKYTDAEARTQGDAAVTAHEGESNPHSEYATDADLAAHAATTHGGGGEGTGDDAFDWATVGNTDRIPVGKIPSSVALQAVVDTEVEDIYANINGRDHHARYTNAEAVAANAAAIAAAIAAIPPSPAQSPHWFGDQTAFDAIVTRDDATIYFVE